jgi:hypothetical protein
MDRGTLYDDDICAWSEQQADALRRLLSAHPELSNELDIAHVAEEIEDVGKSQRDAAESYIRLILVHLIKLAAAPDAPAAAHWRTEVVTFHIDLLGKLTPSMAQRLDLGRLWRMAQRQARAALAEHGIDVPPLAPGCPLDVADLAREDFDMADALARLNLDAADRTTDGGG